MLPAKMKERRPVLQWRFFVIQAFLRPPISRAGCPWLLASVNVCKLFFGHQDFPVRLSRY